MAPKPKLTGDQVQQIASRLKADPSLSQAALAQEYGIDAANLSRALAKLKTPAPAPPATPGESHSTYIPFEQLVTSSLNPRKTFDDTEIDELAESIAQDGLLQNLVVRPGPENTFIIVSGERRYRALAVLHINNRLHTPVPCRIVEADDAKHLVLALLENLARVDVPPLEEAQAFIDLQNIDPATWTPKAIAKAISRTTRYVYQRVALATKLSPETKTLLSNHQITVEGARLLSTLDASAQADLLAELIDQYDHIPTDAIRYEISHTFIPTSRALFDIAASGIATFEDGDDEFVLDRAEFWKHQNAAIEAQRAELSQIWGWVEVTAPGTSIQWGDYITDDAAKPKSAGAIICVAKNGAVHIESALVKREADPTLAQPDPTPSSACAPTVIPAKAGISPASPHAPDLEQRIARENPDPAAKSPVTKKHIYHAHARKTVALRAAICEQPDLAIRLATFALLMPSNTAVKISGQHHNNPIDDRIPITELHAVDIDRHTAKIKKHLTGLGNGDKRDLTVWQHIQSLDHDKLMSLFAALVAREVSTAAGFDCTLGDTPLAVEIARAACVKGSEHLHGLTVQREDLNGIRKQTLLHLADDFGTPAINDELSPKDIADAIARHNTKHTKHILPTMRFATTAEIEKELSK